MHPTPGSLPAPPMNDANPAACGLAAIFRPFDSRPGSRKMDGKVLSSFALRCRRRTSPKIGGNNMLLGFIGSAWQWIIVLAIVMLLFGNRLPMVARSLGRSLTEFKKGIKEVEDQSSTSQMDEQERTSHERVAR